MARILHLDPSKPSIRKVRIAAEAIRNGKLVAFPTETVYGLGADALNANACKRIFEVKNRAHDDPLIVHVNSIEMARQIGYMPSKYERAIRKVWPGPITFVVKARARIPKIVTAGLDSVAIRMPKNKVARLLIKESGRPIAAPSVNISTKPSATEAKHIKGLLEKKIDVILDAGRSKFGLESTILDLRNFTLLRPGSFTVEQIEKQFKRKPRIPAFISGHAQPKKILSPGMKYRHYSPSTPLFLFDGKIERLSSIVSDLNLHDFAFIGSSQSCKVLGKKAKYTISLGSKKSPYQLANNLFDKLILLDSLKVRFAIIEHFSGKGIGFALMNRISKATNNNAFCSDAQLNALLGKLSVP